MAADRWARYDARRTMYGVRWAAGDGWWTMHDGRWPMEIVLYCIFPSDPDEEIRNCLATNCSLHKLFYIATYLHLCRLFNSNRVESSKLKVQNDEDRQEVPILDLHFDITIDPLSLLL